MAWIAVLLSCLAFLLRESRRKLDESADMLEFRPASHYIDGPGCVESYDVDMEPYNSKLNSYIEGIVHCHSYNDAEGLFIIKTREALPHAVMKLRLSGPEVHVVPIKHHSAKLHYGQYRLASPGEYHVEAMILYTHFNESHVQDSVFTMDGETLVSRSPFVVTRRPSYPSGVECSHIDKWNVDSEYREYLRKTRMWAQDPWPVGHPIIHDLLPSITNATGLYFESNCKPIMPRDLFNPDWIPCLKKAKLCMWGDSQMRHLHNTIVAALFYKDDGNLMARKGEALEGPDYITYFPKRWDNFDQDIDGLLASGNCTTVIANFGQWPAGWPEEYPWQFDKYRVYVEADMVYLKQLERKYSGVRTYWTTTNPHGYAGYGILKGCEWRTDPVLDRYHNITLELALAHDMNVLDTYRIAKPLNDLTYDGSHYQGIVGWTLATYGLQSICKN